MFLGLGRNSEKKISKKIRSEIYVGRAMSSPNLQTGHVSTQITFGELAPYNVVEKIRVTAHWEHWKSHFLPQNLEKHWK